MLLEMEGRGHSLHYTNNTSKYGPTPGGAKFTFGTMCLPCTSIGAICAKYNFGKYNCFLRPDKAMLFVMAKAFMCL